jgi:hypothetical protein
MAAQRTLAYGQAKAFVLGKEFRERLHGVKTVNRICDPSHVFLLGFPKEMAILSFHSYLLPQ